MIKVKHRKPSQKRDASAHECKYVDSVATLKLFSKFYFLHHENN